VRTFLIDYDLNAPGKDYSTLIAHIRSYGNYCRYLKSAWLIRTDSTTTAVRDAAAAYMDANDGLMVIDVTADVAAWRGLSAQVANWIGTVL
jgi:hypothetical protein